MEILLFIHRIFMLPYRIVSAIYSYVLLFKKYKKEIRDNDSNEHLVGFQLIMKVNDKLGKNQEEIKNFTELLEMQIGILKYVLPIVFWMLIIYLVS